MNIKSFFDFDTKTILYKVVENYDKIQPILKENVFKKVNVWPYNLSGLDYNSRPKIYYDYHYFKLDSYFGWMSRKPCAELTFLDNSLHSLTPTLHIQVKKRTNSYIVTFLFAIFFVFFLVVLTGIVITETVEHSYFVVLMIVLVLFPFFIGLSYSIFQEHNYSKNRDKLISKFEKLLRDNGVVLEIMEEKTTSPIWIKKIKNIFK